MNSSGTADARAQAWSEAGLLVWFAPGERPTRQGPPKGPALAVQHLNVVLGVEIDKIGDFSPGVTEQMVDDEIARLYGQGVRYIFPIHLTDNVFGDTAIYKPLFDIADFRENGSFWSVGCAQEADEVWLQFAGCDFSASA